MKLTVDSDNLGIINSNKTNNTNTLFFVCNRWQHPNFSLGQHLFYFVPSNPKKQKKKRTNTSFIPIHTSKVKKQKNKRLLHTKLNNNKKKQSQVNQS